MRKVDEYRRAASNRRVDWQDLDSVRQRRKYTRRGVQLEARVRTGARDLLATAENISPGGAFLRVDLPVETEDLVDHPPSSGARAPRARQGPVAPGRAAR